MNYYKFIDEAIEVDPLEPKKFVKGDKKLMKLFISPRLEDLLKKMLKTADFQAKAVASRILNIDQEPDENLFDISYIDIDKDKDDSLSYMPARRAWFKMGFKSQDDANKKPDPNCEMWTGAGRQSLGVGKFINKLFDDFTDVAVAKFVATYRAEIAATMIYDRFKIVTGEDIRKWYAESNYYKGENANKGLNGSCMRYDGIYDRARNCQPYFDIYCKNPENCALLILTNRDDKLLGRAIVWKNLRKPEGATFMDRVYVVKDSDEELFKKYATEQGWIYKHSQQAYDSTYIDKGQKVNKSLAVKLNPIAHKTYPFMDTLKYYNPTTGRLGSDPGNPVEGSKRLKLEGGGGAPSQNLD